MHNRIHPLKLAVCLALCAASAACGGLLEKVDSVRSAHEELTGTPTNLAADLTPKSTDIVDEAKRQGAGALIERARSDAETPKPVAQNAE